MGHRPLGEIGISADEGDETARISELRAGSEEAFDRLIAEYTPLVFRLAYRLLNDPAEAPDTVQEVFLKIFRNIGGFQGDCSLKTWVYRIALNTASNQNRWWRRHRGKECALDSPDYRDGEECLAPADEGPNPYDSVLARETQEVVQRALVKLTESSRTVLVLREMEGLRYDEVAEVLHISEGTVKSRLARARLSLKRELELLLEPTAGRSPVLSPVEE